MIALQRSGAAVLVCALICFGGCAAPRTGSHDAKALQREIARADAAYRGLRPDGVVVYNRAVAGIAREMEALPPEELQARFAAAGVAFDLRAEKLPLIRYHLVRPLRSNGSSVGIPMLIEYDTRGEPLYPPEGMLQPVTAIYTRAGGAPHLSLVAEKSSVTLNGSAYPVTTDYNAAGLTLARRARRLAQSGFRSMIRPAHMERKPQIYLIDPYDPHKIPVLMVHGLQSTPVAFLRLVNVFRQDPEIRKHFQVWHFHYATGTPLLVNALTLREELARTVRKVDPRDHDFATKHIVVLGHSMGGLMSHTLVSSSGNHLWDSLFTVSPERLQGNVEAVNLLRRVMFFERNRRVVRIIFMSTPHRGSAMSDSLIGSIAKSLTRLSPVLQTELSELAVSNPSSMTPAGSAFYRRTSFSSIRTLSPRNPTLLALSRLKPSAPFHSIIGQRRVGPRSSGSDGVVAYTSSHLDGAASEFIAQSGHKVFDNPDAQHEVMRILRLELRPANGYKKGL